MHTEKVLPALIVGAAPVGGLFSAASGRGRVTEDRGKTEDRVLVSAVVFL